MAHIWMRHATLLCASLVLMGVLATPALAQPGSDQHYCESLNGRVVVQRGRARCTTDGTSHAMATGRGALAVARDGGTATANGDGSSAHAGGTGSPGGTATAIGVGSYAVADSGGEAIANGDGSYAAAHVGYASASGTNSRAQAVDPGSIAKANGTNSHAIAINGGKAEADGVDSFAQAGGTGSSASAVGDGSSATASGNCAVYAEAGETRSCTGT